VAFVINQHAGLRKDINSFFKEHQDDLNRLLGETRFVVSEKKHPTIASLLFAKRSFSRVPSVVLSSQKCRASRCKSCATMNLPKKMMLNGFLVKLDFTCDCSTDSAIYLARCKNCVDPIEKDRNFYFGQTVTTVRARNNGHRDKFKLSQYDKSALSYHIFDKHPDSFPDKLLNYDFGVVKKVSPQNLDRVEDFYIYNTVADEKGLNRYKVAR
jgi:hypothetical protein